MFINTLSVSNWKMEIQIEFVNLFLCNLHSEKFCYCPPQLQLNIMYASCYKSVVIILNNLGYLVVVT